ncbi:MAG: hypothetical protein Kow0077_31730 [Anaerolineae bacterium]
MQAAPANPDFHFLCFAPGLEHWIFRAAQRYWNAYRPILYSMQSPEDVSLITYALGGGRTVAVTLVMRRDTAAAVRSAVTARLADVYLDPLVYDTPTDLQLTLNARVEFNQRFGVPPQDNAPVSRTPGPVTGN